MLRYALPWGYRRSNLPARPKLDSFTVIIDQIVTADRTWPAPKDVVLLKVWIQAG